jgi:hypothetical protein
VNLPGVGVPPPGQIPVVPAGQSGEKPKDNVEENQIQRDINRMFERAIQTKGTKKTGIDLNEIIDSVSKNKDFQARLPQITQRMLTEGVTGTQELADNLNLLMAKHARNSGVDLSQPTQLGGFTLQETAPSSIGIPGTRFRVGLKRNLSMQAPGYSGNAGYTLNPVGAALGAIPYAGGIGALLGGSPTLGGYLSGQHDLIGTTTPTSQRDSRAKAETTAGILQALIALRNAAQ